MSSDHCSCGYEGCEQHNIATVADLRAENERLHDMVQDWRERATNHELEVGQQAEALAEIHEEMANFGRYSRGVAKDAMGLNRLTWIERAEWAERLARLADASTTKDAS